MFDRQGVRKYVNSSERAAFLQTVSDEEDMALRAFALTLFYTGCRISEGLKLTAERVDFSGKRLVFETLKRRRPGHFRGVPVPERLLALLGPLTAGRQPSDCVWRVSRSTAYRLIKDHMHRVQIVGTMASPKGLRHGFAIACLTHKIPLPTVQKWLGHSRLETTAIYLEVAGDEERDLASRMWLGVR